MKLAHVFALTAALAIVPTGLASAADGWVTAESRYGPKTISGPVRRVGNHRYQVRLPGGTWLDCGISCSDTLRRETIDFWDNHGAPRSGSDGPGYFYWRW